MRNKRVTKITAALNSLNKEDIYSLLLFTLYKMRDIPEYLTLSELSYILDGESLNRFLSYFGGMTLTIPSSKDLRLVVKALMLYQYINIEEESFEEALKAVCVDEFSPDEIKETYTKIVEVISNYEFKRN